MATRRFVSTLAGGAAVLVVSLAVAATPAGAAPGDLDPTFGTGGIVTTDFADEQVDAAVLQPDGRIVVAGSAAVDGNVDFALVRYLADGTLDPTFGVGGVVLTDFAGGFDAAFGLVLQADGKLVAAGQAEVEPFTADFALARYLPDGTLDPTFGDGGKVTTGGNESIQALVLQPNGKLVATGVAGGFVVVRYLPDGTLDPDFGTNGIVMTDIDGVADALVVQPDGNIVLSGFSFAEGLIQLTLARYLPDGTLDPGFGTGGIVTTNLAGRLVSAGETAVIVQPDGKLVVAAQVALAGTEHIVDLVLVRFLADGTLDPNFGTGGIVIPEIGSTAPLLGGLVLQPDGKIVAASAFFDFPGPTNDVFAVVRFLPDGTLDPGFGTGGIVTTTFPGIDSFVRALLLQPDGKLVAVGQGGGFVLVRYLGGTGTAGGNDDGDGDGDGDDPYDTYDDDSGDPAFEFDTPFDDPQTTAAANPVQDTAGANDTVRQQPTDEPPAPGPMPNDPAQPAPSDVAPAAELPRTGTDTADTIRLGVLLAALGSLTILISRRRTVRA